MSILPQWSYFLKTKESKGGRSRREKKGVSFQKQNRLSMEDHRLWGKENLTEGPWRKKGEVILHLGRGGGWGSGQPPSTWWWGGRRMVLWHTKVLEKQEKDRGLGLCSEEGNGKRSSRFPSGLSLRTVHASSHRAGREKGIEDEREQMGAGLTWLGTLVLNLTPGSCVALEFTGGVHTPAGPGQDHEKHRDTGWGRGGVWPTGGGTSRSSSGCWVKPLPSPSAPTPPPKSASGTRELLGTRQWNKVTSLPSGLGCQGEGLGRWGGGGLREARQVCDGAALRRQQEVRPPELPSRLPRHLLLWHQRWFPGASKLIRLH